jgi:hypothetical protein
MLDNKKKGEENIGLIRGLIQTTKNFNVAWWKKYKGTKGYYLSQRRKLFRRIYAFYFVCFLTFFLLKAIVALLTGHGWGGYVLPIEFWDPEGCDIFKMIELLKDVEVIIVKKWK